MTLLLKEVSANLHEFKETSGRVFHGRGGFFDGYRYLNIDWYPPYLLIQNHADSLEAEAMDQLTTLFEQHQEIEAVLLQNRSGIDANATVLFERRTPVAVPITLTTEMEHGLKCDVILGKNRNTGVFLDMRSGWNWIRAHAKDKKVLNLFSYTGVFSLFALNGGAVRVDNIDMAANVQKTAQRNHHKNQTKPGAAAFYKYNIMKSLKKISRMGPYDLIIIDPPPCQKNAFQGWNDYQKLLTVCRTCLSPGGTLFACLNNPQISRQQFENDLRDILPDCHHIEHIPLGQEIKETDSNKGLKLVALRFLP